MSEFKHLSFPLDSSCCSSWRQVSLEDVATITMGQSPDSKTYNLNQEGLPLLQGNADIANGVTSPKQYTSAPTKFCNTNDIVVTVRAPVGEVAIAKEKCCIGRGVCSLRANSEAITSFIYYLLVAKKSLWNNLEQGSTFSAINSSDIKSFKISIPSLIEQQWIAEFFTALDEKIRIHEQKLTKLISAKDSILLKLFKQEIRLKDKDGSDFHPWIKVKIGDILKVKHGKDYKHLSPGKIPVMATSGAISYVDTALCTWPCALIGRKGTIDKPQFMDKPFWCIDTLFYTKALGNHSPLFQYYLFQTIDWKKFNEGTGLPSLSASTIESIQCSIPMEKEQQEIANFLRIYDEKVKICTKKIEALKQLKKAFMQRMFV